METTNGLWVARDEDGLLYLYTEMPTLNTEYSGTFSSENGYFHAIPSDWYGEVTYENSPQRLTPKTIKTDNNDER